MDTIVSGTTNLYRLPVPHPRTITSTSSTIYSSTWLASLPFNKLSLHSRNRRKLGLSIRTSSSSVRNLPITCVTEIGESQFPDVVLKSDRPVLVEFVASWCGPCRLMASAIDSLAQEYKEKMTVVKIDHDANPKIIEELKVYGLPTLILFKNGKEVPESRREGALTLAKLKTYVDSLLDSVSVS
ncbi:hypothetical protein LguiA_031395 [Lonicera macranthoides]